PEGNATVLQKVGFEPIGRLAGEVALHRPAIPRTYVVHAVAPVPDEAASLAWVVAHAGEAGSIVAVEPDGGVGDAAGGIAAPPPRRPSSSTSRSASRSARAPRARGSSS